MKRLLILTKIHPIAAIDLTSRLTQNFGEVAVSYGPFTIMEMVREQKGFPTLELFYPSLSTFNDYRDEVTEEARIKDFFELFITVGTDVDTSRFWYDYVVGFDDGSIDTDYEFDEDFNEDKLSYLTLKDADLVFKNFTELQIFIVNILRRKQENEQI